MKQENKSVADLLVEFRKTLGMNMSEFARTANVDVAHYSRIEKGDVMPGFKTLLALIHTYHIDPRKLFHYNKGGRNERKKGVKNRRK
jgi:transcriptional regulator with XRE-family HTH domain